jgi:hypothetical protein
MSANLRALCVVVSPLVYGWLFGLVKGRPELTFYGGAAFIAAAEMALRA